MDGLQLIRSLRQKKGLEEIPAVALTGYASRKDAESALAASFNMHLAKPIEPAELSSAVEKLLDFYQSDRVVGLPKGIVPVLSYSLCVRGN